MYVRIILTLFFHICQKTSIVPQQALLLWFLQSTVGATIKHVKLNCWTSICWGTAMFQTSRSTCQKLTLAWSVLYNWHFRVVVCCLYQCCSAMILMHVCIVVRSRPMRHRQDKFMSIYNRRLLCRKRITCSLRATWCRCVSMPNRTMWLRAACTPEDSIRRIIIIEYIIAFIFWTMFDFIFLTTE